MSCPDIISKNGHWMFVPIAYVGMILGKGETNLQNELLEIHEWESAPKYQGGFWTLGYLFFLLWNMIMTDQRNGKELEHQWWVSSKSRWLKLRSPDTRVLTLNTAVNKYSELPPCTDWN